MIKGKNYTVHIGNNLDILPTLESNSVDSIVTDPPYELGFMGKKWDSSGIAYNVELWRECLRVLKPGGHMLAFGGTRTWHRIAVAIEDAGFEVRDSIAWMYGSGFPKSLDISKAIDKHDATEARKRRDLEFTAWMRSTGITAAKINELTGSSMASHYLSDKEQPQVPTERMFSKLRPYLPEVPDYVEKLVAEKTNIESQNYKNREVIGQKQGTKSVDSHGHGIVPGGITEAVTLDITAPATPGAKQWEGWGTALKPAFEPVIVARKPLIGTVAENVLTYGTGGLNIDASRISSNGEHKRPFQPTNNDREVFGKQNGFQPTNAEGRWPANVILDTYTAELLDEQSDASRFFYVAKASKRDRNEGLEGLEAKAAGSLNMRTDAHSVANGMETKPAQNFHPTVKPTSLMEYLIKLVTPPNGLVLDPFTGSGSTGKAALLNGFRFVGCELTEDYIPIIEGRLNHAESVAEQKEQEKDEALF